MAKKKFFIKGQGLKKEVEHLKAKVEGLEVAISTANKKTPRTRKKRTAIYSPPVAVETKNVDTDVETKNVEAKNVVYESSELEFPL